MIPGQLIYKTIETLMKRFENNKISELQTEEGYIWPATCIFHESASEYELIQFEESLGYKLPVDYRNFLQITNGCLLFEHPQYGGENHLYKWQEIKEATYEDPNEGYLKMAYIGQDNIVIDLKAYHEGDHNYLLVKDHIEHFHKARRLNMNFELWFDRFIVSQGSKFWSWSIYTAENYYRTRG